MQTRASTVERSEINGKQKRISSVNSTTATATTTTTTTTTIASRSEDAQLHSLFSDGSSSRSSNNTNSKSTSHTSKSVSGQLQHLAFDSCLRHKSSSMSETMFESFRRSIETSETNDTLYTHYGEGYKDFRELVDEQDFRESSVSSESSTVSDSRTVRIVRNKSDGPLIRTKVVIGESGEQIDVAERPRIRVGSAAIQKATESCPNSPLNRKIKQSYFSESIAESGESVVVSSAQSSLNSTMEEQEKQFYYELSDRECEATTVNVSIGEQINIKEVVQRRQETAKGGQTSTTTTTASAQNVMAERRQRVTSTESFASSREGTPTRVPFERSVSAVATVKRTDSGRSSSGLNISQRDILVNRSRSWNAIEANLFTSSGGGVGSLDHTILAEANGLIADMLMDHGLPPNIASGLKALQILLCPSQQNKPLGVKAVVGQKVELAPLSEPGDIDDCGEIPFTGEKPSDMSKTRRQLPRSLLRRMSTSTWSTTTSATGMPTLEPEPSRKRSTGTRRGEESLSAMSLPDDVLHANERLMSESSDATQPVHMDFICKYCGRRNSNTRKTSDPVVSEEKDTRSFDAKVLSPGIYEVNGIQFDTLEIVKDAHLGTLCDWDFNIFQLTDRSPQTLLSTMCYRILFGTGLVEAFHIPEKELLCYLHALECGYREVPYHNKMHAADVLHAVFYLTTQPVAGLEQTLISDLCIAQEYQRTQPDDENALTYGIIASNLPPLELLALYIAAAMHDFEHPGRTNAFIVATHAPLAILYNDRSVLENHHAAAAWNLLLSKADFNFLKNLETAEFKKLRYVVIECILATDLKRHFEVLAEFTAKTNLEESAGINWNDEADRLLVLEMAIKLSDINGPCKKRDLYMRWMERICEEFYEQGDEEASLGLPISPFMDRAKPQMPKLQESFINHLVAPLCNAYAVAGLLPGKWVVSAQEATNGNHPNASMDLKDGVKASANNRVECIQIKHLQDNYAYWIKVIQEEKTKETKEAIETS
ncbi:probable 3',5'-cyclic phosphodiesterase pde-3 isoform X2 [Varroa destructor]|uniref:Phosphodiesterase n=1 Tax=Varroa destructor TaxID=109461 RepID=A0A7M7JFC8_VARDE|nr:probable 3',5'-cyclic phosphodiesterase pde-3 isoform X2 [Varroa destructor]